METWQEILSGKPRRGRPVAPKKDLVHLHILIPRELSMRIEAHGQKKSVITIKALEKYLDNNSND